MNSKSFTVWVSINTEHTKRKTLNFISKHKTEIFPQETNLLFALKMLNFFCISELS